MNHPRAQLSRSEAQRFLGIPVDYALPSGEDALVADARMIVDTNLALARDIAKLSRQGLQLSPIWEDVAGVAHARLAVLPSVFRTRYFDSPGAEAWEHGGTFQMAAEVLPWLIDDPTGAAFALEDTHRAWYDADAPTRSLGLPFRGHLRALSLVLADFARKDAAGFDELEWLASIGLPFAESRDDDDPPPEAIVASMHELTRAMWSEEQGWLRAAFGG